MITPLSMHSYNNYNVQNRRNVQPQFGANISKLAKFEIVDEKLWKELVAKNSDPYGSGVMRYAAKWANMMEEQIKAGKKLEEIAENLSFKADTEGITGFMYGCAVNTLSKVWKHGEALRKWHNAQYTGL